MFALRCNGGSSAHAVFQVEALATRDGGQRCSLPIPMISEGVFCKLQAGRRVDGCGSREGLIET